jgi:putative ATP-dependent endonuclease of the OLD family
MLIRSLTIKNYRCIREVSVELSDLTAFVGRNGSGKSTFLQSLGAFYNVKAALTENDFYNGDITHQIEITVEYGDLSQAEKTEFSAYLDGEVLAVTKKIRMQDGKLEQKYFAATKQIPEIAAIRREGNVTAKRAAWNQLVAAAEMQDIGPASVRGDDPEVHMKAYEDKHPELSRWTEQEVQFFGPPNIGGGKLDNFTKFVYVPAVRDASDDSADKKGSVLFQLLDFIVLRRFRVRQDVRALQSEFSTKLKQLYEPAKLTEFDDLAKQISSTLRLYVPNAQLGLRLAEPTLPEIPTPATLAHLVEDDYAGAIDKKGHGLQRALIFSLLQHLAVAKPIEGSNDSTDLLAEVASESEENHDGGADTDQDHLDAVGPELIIAIEEPELYQHPLRARHLSRVLLEMSRKSSIGPGGRNQILYTTHSPYFVDLERFDQLRMIRKNRQSATEPPCSSVTRYSLQSAAAKMAEITGKPANQFTAQSFRARAYPIMTQTVNEGFFADTVVLVEGDTEVAALFIVANRMGCDWLSTGVAVIPVAGKNKIDRAAVVFSGLGIPTYVVFDADCRHKGNKDREKQTTDTNRLLLRLCGVAEEDFPSTVASSRHACFAEDFETYCSKQLGSETYERLRKQSALRHGFDSPSDGMKNFDVVVDLVNSIYDEGQRLEFLEEIVTQVNLMTVLEAPTQTILSTNIEEAAESGE